MAGRYTRHWMSCALGLLFLGGFMAAPVPLRAAEPDFNMLDAEEDLPDMNYVRSQAESGRARSQTQLADFYLTLADYTNAVAWYQKAASQNHVPAQLSLAGCLLAGRGVDRNPQSAAQWLRRAADTIEAKAGTTNPTPAISAAKPAAPQPTTNVVTARVQSPVVAKPPAVAVTPGFTNTPSPARIQSLLAAEPDLLESPTGLRSPGDTR